MYTNLNIRTSYFVIPNFKCQVFRTRSIRHSYLVIRNLDDEYSRLKIAV